MDIAEKLRRINSQDERKLHRIVGESLPALVESPEPLDRKVIRQIYVGELRMMGRMMIYADLREFFPPRCD